MKARRKQRDIPNTNAIYSFLHCGLCLEELTKLAEIQGSASPRLYARLSVGFTEIGLQVWCNHHEVNVVHIDFQGAVHPANLTRKADENDG